MSMNPVTVHIRKELLARGVTCLPDLQSVLVGVVLYFEGEKQRAAMTNPIPVIRDPEPYPEPEMPIDAHSSGPQFDAPAPTKPKAKTKKKAAK